MGEPALTDGWHLDRYREGDETAILELFAAVFGQSRSLAHWTWQFKRNPYAGPFVTIADAMRTVRPSAFTASCR